MSRDPAKAELHCHLEGTLQPAMVRRLAARHGMRLGRDLFDAQGGYAFTDFAGFLAAYDSAAACLRTAADYAEVTADYLASVAREGALYVEVFISPDHARAVGLAYGELVEGIAEGFAAAEQTHAIVGRAIAVAVRHLGPERALSIARQLVSEPHPVVVGFGLAGDETAFHPKDFRPAFALVEAAGYPSTAHAGEVCGPESVRAVLDHLPVSRLGHGVRAAEDPPLLERIARDGIALEVCLGSNLALGLYPEAACHPLPRLLAQGCRVTLNSDDPPFFRTSLGQEYARAARDFGLDRERLLAITRTAIEVSFAEAATKARLLARLARKTAT